MLRKSNKKANIENEIVTKIPKTDNTYILEYTLPEKNSYKENYYALMIQQYRYTEGSVLFGVLSLSPLMFLHLNPFNFFRKSNIVFDKVNLPLHNINFTKANYEALKISDKKAKELLPTIVFPDRFKYNVYANVFHPGERIYMLNKKDNCRYFSRSLEAVARRKYSLIPNMLVFGGLMIAFELSSWKDL